MNSLDLTNFITIWFDNNVSTMGVLWTYLKPLMPLITVSFPAILHIMELEVLPMIGL